MATDAERNRGLGAYSTPGVDVKNPQDTALVPLGSAPQIAFKTTHVDPPSFVYLGREDRMLSTFIGGVSGQTVSVAVRILRPDGTVIVNVFNYTIVTARSLVNFTQELTEGFLLSVVVTLPSEPLGLKTYGCIELLRGLFVGGGFDAVLCKGYINLFSPLAWPSTNNKDTWDGQGSNVDVTGSTPAAGADISEIMPNFTRRILKTITASLTTGAGVANREATLVITDGVNVLASIPSTFTQVASLTHRYTWGLGLQTQAGAQALIHTAPLPSMLLQNAYRITTVTTNIQAADQWTAPQYEVEEWFDI